MKITAIAATVLLPVLIACGGGNTESNIKPPGNEESAKTRVLEKGAAVLQNKRLLRR